MSFKRYMIEWIATNPGKSLGVGLGFIIGFLVVLVGIKKTLIVLLFVLLGYLLGKMSDEGIFNLRNFRNPFRRK